MVRRKKIARGFRLSTARRGDRDRENQETKPKVAEVIKGSISSWGRGRKAQPLSWRDLG